MTGITQIESIRRRDGDGRRRSASVPTVEGIVSAATCPAAATDPDNRIVAWNPAFANLLGDENTIAGSNLQQLLECRHPSGNRLSLGHESLHEMVLSGEAPAAFEIDIAPAHRPKLRVEVSIVVVIDGDSHRLVYLMRPRLRRRRLDAMLERLLTEAEPRHNRRSTDRPRTGLTRRQLEVLRLMALGATAGEIADELGITANTVRSHIRGIFDALGVTRQTEAVAHALRDGLI